MKVARLALVLFGFAGVFANDQLWIELMSAQIETAVHYDLSADKNIPELALDLGLNTLVKFVKTAGLAETLSGTGPFTVFGPTDDAFSKLPKPLVDFLLKNVTALGEILKYHVASGNFQSTELKNDMLVPSLEGKNIRINIYKDGKVITATGRPVTVANQNASNGVIHEVGAVLFPPPGTIAFVVEKCPVFSTLLKAVSLIPAIVKTLDGDGPFTLFAPSDKAFAKIPEKCLAALLKDEKLLTKVLEYHVVPATGYSAGLSCGDELKTVEGSTVKITIIGKSIRVNWSKVTFADGSATNGVIHVIDRVLFPKELDDFCDGNDFLNDDDEGKNDDIGVWKNLFN